MKTEDEIAKLQEKAEQMTNEQLIKRSEKLRDFFTPNGKNWKKMAELVEIERELTLREGE